MPLIKKRNLVDGFKRFRQKYFVQETGLYENLSTKGQSPKTLIIACSDSRVDPAILLAAEPGDFFVIRNVANLVPPYEEGGGHHGTSAAIEFAVKNLQVELIIVLGHAQCGGINALAVNAPGNDNSFIGKWVSIAADARQRAVQKVSPDNFREFCRCCEREAIITSINNLKTFPFISEREATGKLMICGWYFDLEEGKLLEYSDKLQRYIEL